MGLDRFTVEPAIFSGLLGLLLGHGSRRPHAGQARTAPGRHTGWRSSRDWYVGRWFVGKFGCGVCHWVWHIHGSWYRVRLRVGNAASSKVVSVDQDGPDRWAGCIWIRAGKCIHCTVGNQTNRPLWNQHDGHRLGRRFPDRCVRAGSTAHTAPQGLRPGRHDEESETRWFCTETRGLQPWPDAQDLAVLRPVVHVRVRRGCRLDDHLHCQKFRPSRGRSDCGRCSGDR